MNRLKNEKGSITLFVLIAMLFFVMYLVGMYMLSANAESSQIAETARIKEIYEQGINNIDDVYATLANVEMVNAPKLGTGMIPVKCDGTEFVETTYYDEEWYDYADTSISGNESTSKWANVETQDGSMWVWIPRYAYKIKYTNVNDKSAGGTIEVVFLNGTTNNDFNGKDVTSENYIDENGSVGAYIVHPAFQDGRASRYANGEWDREITGFWVAKFEAGYAGTAGNATTAQDSTVKLSTLTQWDGSSMVELTTNYYGNRAVGDFIKYPVFQPNRPSMNNLPIADAYDLSKSLTETNNPYGLKNVDSHLMKNSEWGAVAYLTHSKYGRNGTEVTRNNVSANNTNTIYAVTGFGVSAQSAGEDITRSLETLITEGTTGSWSTKQGVLASTTGNIYGVYDLSGGLYEWTAGYVATDGNYKKHGGNLIGDSNKYKSLYEYNSTGNDRGLNYLQSRNVNRVGEAIWETSSLGEEGTKTSWNNDYSEFWYSVRPFSVRGGRWGNVSEAGLFAFFRFDGTCLYFCGFRPVLVTE